MSMPKKRKATSDAVEILHRRFYQGKPERLAQLEAARTEDDLARRIYELREQAGLTQARLAKMVGTSESVISNTRLSIKTCFRNAFYTTGTVPPDE